MKKLLTILAMAVLVSAFLLIAKMPSQATELMEAPKPTIPSQEELQERATSEDAITVILISGSNLKEKIK